MEQLLCKKNAMEMYSYIFWLKTFSRQICVTSKFAFHIIAAYKCINTYLMGMGGMFCIKINPLAEGKSTFCSQWASFQPQDPIQVYKGNKIPVYSDALKEKREISLQL